MKIFAVYLSPRQISGNYRDQATTVSFQILSGSSAAVVSRDTSLGAESVVE